MQLGALKKEKALFGHCDILRSAVAALNCKCNVAPDDWWGQYPGPGADTRLELNCVTPDRKLGILILIHITNTGAPYLDHH